MKIQKKCLPCIVNQALRLTEMLGTDNASDLLRQVFAYLSQVDFDRSVTPELIGDIFALLKTATGNQDPYRDTRHFYNQMFLDRLEAMEQEMDSAADPFAEAVKYAISGNIIDFFPIHELTPEAVQAYFTRLKQEELTIDDSARLREEVAAAQTVLYLGDNCGEICLDKLLMKKLKQLNPACQFYFATRGSAVVNDSIKEDAYFVGMQAFATIIDNGDGSLGTVCPRTSQAFREIFDRADVIIAKGQANYECLSDGDKNVYFLLMTKCKVIADDIGVPEMKMICMRKV